ncbi:MAG: hypothetical protein HUJ26_23405 [Planctomycetaceae bacterium]|nr:hypothetical protein [Planctomycetaceae bacterium]
MNVFIWIRTRGKTTNRIMNLTGCIIWPRWNCLLSEFSDSGDICGQYPQIICTCDANPLSVKFDFERDHLWPNDKAAPAAVSDVGSDFVLNRRSG